MNDELDRAEGLREVRFPRSSLRFLAGLEGLEISPLSPLSGMGNAAGARDTQGLLAELEGWTGPWQWAIPSLMDPRHKVALLFAREGRALLGQYLFPDADASGPGFWASVAGDELALSGPWTMGEARVGFLELLNLGEVTDSPPARLDLTSPQFRALAAFLDAYRTSFLARDLVRLGGEPDGVSSAEVVGACRNGIAVPNPEWAVSMLCMLVPDDFPPRSEDSLPGLLEELVRAGFLDAREAGGGAYAPRGDLARLCRELCRSNATYGIVTQRLDSSGGLEMGILYGWRTGEGIWLVNLGGSGERELAIIQVGPYPMTELLMEMLPEKGEYIAPEDFAMETPYARDRLLSLLREAKPPAAGPETCMHCGAYLARDALFCRSCGKAVERAGETAARAVDAGEKPSFCSYCGNKVRPGAKFCRNCGKALK